MVDESDVVQAYIHLLGRVPAAAEVAATMAHFSAPGADQSADMRDSIFRSEEFRNRRVGAYRWTKFTPLELDRPRLVFVHIEKSGGTTLRAMLEAGFEPSRVCPERGDGLGNWTIHELAAYDLFAGHFDLSVCRSIPGELRVFTMLREPKARLLSLYQFYRSHLPDPERDNHSLMSLARELDAEAFFAHPAVTSHAGVRDAVAGQLIRTGPKHPVGPQDLLVADPKRALERAWRALRGMTAFGLMERFEESRALLNRALGLSMPAVAPRQVLADLAASDPSFVRVPPAPRTARLESLLDALTPIDRALYARAAAVFADRVAGSPASLLARLARRAARRSGAGGMLRVRR